MNPESETNTAGWQGDLKRVASLYLEAAKFTAAEKVTILLAALLLWLIILVLGVGVLVLCTLCLIHLLGAVMPLWASYLIMAALFVALIGSIYLARVPLIIDPMARFVSRLFLNPPKNTGNDNS